MLVMELFGQDSKCQRVQIRRSISRRAPHYWENARGDLQQSPAASDDDEVLEDEFSEKGEVAFFGRSKVDFEFNNACKLCFSMRHN